jgi:hypothetical protein
VRGDVAVGTVGQPSAHSLLIEQPVLAGMPQDIVEDQGVD